MHELSYITRLVNMALDVSRANGSAPIRKITAEVGAMTGVIPYYLNKYFPEAVESVSDRTNALKDTTLEIISIPVKAHCNTCGAEYEPSRENNYLCPACQSRECRIIAGREFLLRSVELDDAPADTPGATNDSLCRPAAAQK